MSRNQDPRFSYDPRYTDTSYDPIVNEPMGFDQYRSRPDLVGNRYIPFQNDPNAQFITETNNEKKNLIDISKAVFITPKEEKSEGKKENFGDMKYDLSLDNIIKFLLIFLLVLLISNEMIGFNRLYSRDRDFYENR